MPQVAFLVCDDHPRSWITAIEVPNDIRDQGHVALRVYYHGNSVGFRSNCRIEYWRVEPLTEDNIRWVHYRDEVFEHLQEVDNGGTGTAKPFCTDHEEVHYTEYTFSFSRRHDTILRQSDERNQIILSCGKVLQPHHLLASGQGYSAPLAKIGKSHRQYAADHCLTNVGELAAKYTGHSSYTTRTQAEYCVRTVEETAGLLAFREQQEAILRLLGGFNPKQLAMLLKAIGKCLPELGLYGQMFRAAFSSDWEYPDIMKLWKALSAHSLPTRTQALVSALLHADAATKDHAIADHMTGAGVLPGPLSEKVKGVHLPFRERGAENLAAAGEAALAQQWNRQRREQDDAQNESCEGVGFDPKEFSDSYWEHRKVDEVMDLDPPTAHITQTDVAAASEYMAEYHTPEPEDPILVDSAGGTTHWAILSCGRHTCSTYKDSMLDQTVDVDIPGVTLSDSPGRLDIVTMARSQPPRAYRYHGLHRVSGTKFRYERIEEIGS